MAIPKAHPGGWIIALFFFPILSTAQTVSIVSGNGQLVCPICPGLTTQSFALLVVQVNGSNGSPVASTALTWTVMQTGGSNTTTTTTTTTTTDSSGQASYNLIPVISGLGQSYLAATVTATALGASVTFNETTVIPSSLAPGVAPVQIQLVPVSETPPLTGTAGATATTPLQVEVLGAQGGLAAVQVRIQSGTGPGQPTVNCATAPGQPAGTILTNTAGIATCTPVFGSTLGSGTYTIVVGGNYATFLPGALQVTAGPPALIRIISGNNQSVNPGAIAPQPLIAEVTDLGGNPSDGASVTWSVLSGSVTLSNEYQASASNGQVSARVTGGGTGGAAQVQVKLTNNSAVQATFSVNVNVIVTAFAIVSGNNQSVATGKAFADPLIVQVNDQSLPVAGVTVNFAVASGSAALSAVSATTNAQGQAQVNITAGATAGPITVVATIGSGSSAKTQTFSLTALPPGPIITAAGVTNTAGFQSQFIAPCGLATIFGTGLATGITGVVSTNIEPQMQLVGVSVQFGAAPAVFSAPVLQLVNENGQQSVSVQVPCEINTGTTGTTVPLVVTANGEPSQPVDVTVLPYAPGIFQAPDPYDGQTRAVLIRPNGSFVSTHNPAQRGEVIRLFVTGLGQTNPALTTGEFDPVTQNADGTVSPEVLPVSSHVLAGVNNAGVLTLAATYAYGFVGVYEVDFQVPADSATGNDVLLGIVEYQGQGTNLQLSNLSRIPIQ
jgi:uncharacterized protein (TIGR03437 family)